MIFWNTFRVKTMSDKSGEISCRWGQFCPTKNYVLRKFCSAKHLVRQKIIFFGWQTFIFFSLCITISKLTFCNRGKNISKQNSNKVVKTVIKSGYLFFERVGKMVKARYKRWIKRPKCNLQSLLHLSEGVRLGRGTSLKEVFGYGFWYPCTIEAINNYSLVVWQVFTQINYPRYMSRLQVG